MSSNGGDAPRHWAFPAHWSLVILCCGILWSLSHFFICNTREIGSGATGYAYLVTGIAFGTLLVLVGLSTNRISLMRPSLLLAFAFEGWLALRVVTDFGTPSPLWAWMLGTTGGTVLGLSLGGIVKCAISCCFVGRGSTAQVCPRMVGLGLTILSVLSTGHSLLCNLDIVREDLFLISDGVGQYQRPGNFIAMDFTMIAMVAAALSPRIQSHIHPGTSAFRLLLTLVLGAKMALSAVLAQLIGSNSAFVVVLAVGMFTIALMWEGAVRHCRAVVFRSLDSFSLSLPSVGFIMRALRPFLVVASVGTGVACLLISGFDLDVSIFRLANFGSAEGYLPTSVTSRLELISTSYNQHLGVSPLVGDLLADARTTGAGSYAHSLPLSLISHTGIVGFALFTLFLLVAAIDHWREIASAGRCGRNSHRQLEFHVFFVVAFLLVVSSVATFFTWMPLWFGLGMWCGPSWRHG